MGIKVIVIGGGASGLMAAGRAAQLGNQVVLCEKNPQLGKKLLITGGGRCNLSNSDSQRDFISKFGKKGRFLYSSFAQFFRANLLFLLKKYGVETKEERGGRIFPSSDRAEDVVNALKKYLHDHQVQIKMNFSIKKILLSEKEIIGVQSVSGEKIQGETVIVATGGASYPQTGSTGEGYKWAREAGHTIVPLKPALVPLLVKKIEKNPYLNNLHLKNVRLNLFNFSKDKIPVDYFPNQDYFASFQQPNNYGLVESRFGEMLMTHFGVSGPLVLQISKSAVSLLEKNKDVSITIDFKPAISLEQVVNRLQREFDSNGKKWLKNILKNILPQQIIPFLLEKLSLPVDLIGSQIKGEIKYKLARLIKSLPFSLNGHLPLENAIVTTGGINLKEINPKTMESKKVKNLYFCGEILDLDADTGGYNLQGAFSTGYVAGQNVGL